MYILNPCRKCITKMMCKKRDCPMLKQHRTIVTYLGVGSLFAFTPTTLCLGLITDNIIFDTLFGISCMVFICIYFYMKEK